MPKLAAVLLVLPLLALAPPARAEAGPHAADAAGALLGFPVDDPVAILLHQLERQGALPEGTVAAARAQSRPPSLEFLDARPACDLDGDGRTDLLVNELALGQPPRLAPADATLTAVSGADGATLWRRDQLMVIDPPDAPGVSFTRVGRATPAASPNALAFPDVDGDGACDALSIEFHRGDSIAVPFVGTPSHAEFTLRVTLVSGRTGEDVWSETLPGTLTSAEDPLLGTVQVSSLRNFLTGVLLVEGASGPRVLLKTTDMDAVHAMNPLYVSTRGEPFGTLTVGRIEYDDVRIGEHVQMRDGKTGDLLWQRDLPMAEGARSTNVTFLAGAADLTGDGEPDALLDQLTLANPRGREDEMPIARDRLYRHGRGMHVLALDGATGETAWTTTVVDLDAVRPKPPVEESFETLQWTSARVGPDVDGDGLPDPLAAYTAREEGLDTTIEGSIRTHFVSLAAPNGTMRWDVRQEGWGVLRPVGTTPETSRLLGMGMVDVPTPSTGDGRFPPKRVRLGVLDGGDGSTLWSYEKAFSQNSYLSYNLALGQYEDALAPLDLDRDGVLDLVTPAQYAPATGKDQVLLATSHHEYEVRSGRDGAVLRTIPLWGPTGRLLACGDAGTTLTFLTGHGRRLDLTRVDAATGETAWRVPLHNDPAPRAATSALDVVTLGARCGTDPDGSAVVGLNMQAFSFLRRHEVVSVLGGLAPDGAVAWMTPTVLGEPNADERLFQASLRASQEEASGSLVPALALGGALGAAGAGATVLLAQRGASRLARILGVALVLVLLAPAPAAALAGLPPGIAPDAPAHLPPPPPAPAGDARPPAPAPLQPRAAAPEEQPPPFDEDDSISFTYDVGDIDGDGIDDLVVDHYCDVYPACNDAPHFLQDPVGYWTRYPCGPKHHVYGVGSATKGVAWDVDLGVPDVPINCGRAFVLGTAPLTNTTGILVYRYTEKNVFGGAAAILHEVVMLDARTGAALWTFAEEGYFASDIFVSTHARSVSIHPVLVDGALFLHGVGFKSVPLHSSFAPTGVAGYDGPVMVTEAYFTEDWFARLDLDTGQVAWRRDDLFLGAQRSILPRVVDERSWYYAYGPDPFLSRAYWDREPCCLDATGDGEADLVVRTLEWSATPGANVEGPHDYSARLLILDGATGATTVDKVVREDFSAKATSTRRDHSITLMEFDLFLPAYRLAYQPLGDVDGDGAGDLLQHELLLGLDTVRTLGVVSGRTGDLLWETNESRDLRAVPLGDADGDGSVDFAAFEWFSHEAASGKMDDYVSPDATPVVARSGRDGRELWRATTFTAPADLEEQFHAMRRNGFPDVDGDGVVDLVLDMPEYLGDQTVIHHLRMVSGRDARVLHETTSVGAFAVPMRVGDRDGDGRDEYAVLSGDVNDLWLTLRESDGDAAWSRRVAAVPASGYAAALPKTHIHLLDDANGTLGLVAVNFHLRLTNAYHYLGGLCVGCDGEAVSTDFTGTIESVTPQLLSLDAATGASRWGIPKVEQVDLLAYVAGETPGTAMLQRVMDAATPLGKASAVLPDVAAGGAAFAGVYGVGLAAVAGVARWARRFEGVPELD